MPYFYNIITVIVIIIIIVVIYVNTKDSLYIYIHTHARNGAILFNNIKLRIFARAELAYFQLQFNRGNDNDPHEPNLLRQCRQNKTFICFCRHLYYRVLANTFKPIQNTFCLLDKTFLLVAAHHTFVIYSNPLFKILTTQGPTGKVK